MLHAGISSYQNTSLALKGSRQQESEMLTRINTELIRAASKPENVADYNNALLRNQRIWNIFLVALTDENHPYPITLKAELISLGIWVNRQTQKAISSRQEVDGLIALNRDIIEGLSPVVPNNNASGTSTDTEKGGQFSAELQYQGDIA